ncbi:flavo protein [Polychaeton citri CBS 116435]|uniref:Flavo protein n=1 Tax=Polychaeton citri CBS 116435 TaxID=1314669 RepID=A0A9P4ULD7_9PEZI|nr:flavo protein [Polychaeton citri CBS 116435]
MVFSLLLISISQPTRFKASDYINDGKRHLLLACTGSVATIKLPNIIASLSRSPNLSIRILISASASKFLQAQSQEQPSLDDIARLPNVDAIYFDAYEWEKPWVRGDSIAHIEFRRWADLMVIAPLSANALARVVNGVSDDLVTSVVRAWDATGLIDVGRPGVPLPYAGGTRKGIVVAPAMNTAMWEHPITKRQMELLSGEWAVSSGGWIEVLRPIEKELACGDSGSGAMRSWEEIASTIKERLELEG